MHVISGLAHLIIPSEKGDESCSGEGERSGDEAWILGGGNGLILALDTSGSGHITKYPSDETTLSIALPLVDGKVPEHVVLGSGPCKRPGIY